MVDAPGVSAAVPERLAAAVRELAWVDSLLVALDFDGTLAPEVDDPEQARALPEARAAVLRLAGMPRTRVALVSGRALQSLTHVADVPATVLLVGSHGIERRLDDPNDDGALDASELDRVAELRRVLSEVADSIDRVWLEQKPAGFALHSRLSTTDDASTAQLMAREAAAELPGLTVREGKNVLEFSVRSTTKGDAVRHLREYTAADAVLYAGDDVTDEDAFGALGADDLGLKVGGGATRAGFSVPAPSDAGTVLALLAELRAAAVRDR